MKKFAALLQADRIEVNHKETARSSREVRQQTSTRWEIGEMSDQIAKSATQILSDLTTF